MQFGPKRGQWVPFKPLYNNVELNRDEETPNNTASM